MSRLRQISFMLPLPTLLWGAENDPTLTLVLGGTTVLFAALAAFAFSRNQKVRSRSHDEIARARHDIEEAGRAKDTFLANVSHETRTPMNAIIGLSHILLQSNLNHEQQLNLLKIKRSAEHLLAITNDILDYSKLEAGKLDLEHRDFELGEFFNNIADIVAASAVEKQLDLIFSIDHKLPQTLHTDPLRLSQVLLNLLNNAIKFTEEGEVILRAYIAEHEVEEGVMQKVIRFEISDTGIGMSDEQISRLFKAFSQADSNVSRKFGGTGLGLAISKQLTEMLGGNMGVLSKFREGSTFFFELPCTEKMLQEVEPENKLASRLLVNKEILIVDQNDKVSTVFARILAHYHANTKIASTIAEATKLLQWSRFDAICVDSRIIYELPPAKLVRQSVDHIILLKYDILESAAVSAYERDTVINKPFVPMTVLTAMTEIFGKSIQENRIEKEKITFEDIMILKGARILLAEDNEGNRMVVEGLLDGSGIDIFPAVNGQKAVEAVFDDASDFDLILMDINMPIMDGFSATSIIREYQKYDNIPILAMTANITESDINKAKSYGMQGHIGKPVNVEEFYKSLLKFIPPQITEDELGPIPVSAEPSGPVSMDNLPGVDTEDGLARLNGNMKAYQNVLKKYADLFSNVVTEFDKHVSSRNFEEGRALAHNLKGLSGNIGATKIYDLAKELEDSFKAQQGQFAPLLQTLNDQIVPLITAIKTMQQAKEADAAPKKPLTPVVADSLIHQLYIHAKKKKAVQVKKTCDELEEYIWPNAIKSLLETVIPLARGYKFAEAARKIEEAMPEITTDA